MHERTLRRADYSLCATHHTFPRKATRGQNSLFLQAGAVSWLSSCLEKLLGYRACPHSLVALLSAAWCCLADYYKCRGLKQHKLPSSQVPRHRPGCWGETTPGSPRKEQKGCLPTFLASVLPHGIFLVSLSSVS